MKKNEALQNIYLPHNIIIFHETKQGNTWKPSTHRQLTHTFSRTIPIYPESRSNRSVLPYRHNKVITDSCSH